MKVLIAFGGGVLAFFSPCFLPLIPAYLVYITGLSFEEVKKVHVRTILHSLAFILGFTIVFTLLGAAVGYLGQFLLGWKAILRVVGGGLLIMLGLYLTGAIKLPFLDLDRKITITNKPAGYLGSIFVGMVFALGWTPCIGPLLAGILIYASQSATLLKGIILLVAFSLGLGLPLLLVALAVNYSLSLLKRIEKYLGIVHFISGLLLVIVGILLIYGKF